MNSLRLWYPPFTRDCAQAGRSSAQAIHSHPQVCAQSVAGNCLAKPAPRARGGAGTDPARARGHRSGAAGGLACSMGGRRLSARGVSSWPRQGGLDECARGGVSGWPCRAAWMSARGPGGDLRLLIRGEAAQVLQDDQGLPSDDHRQGGYQALEAGVIEPAAQRLDRGLDPVDPPVAKTARYFTAQPGSSPCGCSGPPPPTLRTGG